jgi:hypothetical protein
MLSDPVHAQRCCYDGGVSRGVLAVMVFSHCRQMCPFAMQLLTFVPGALHWTTSLSDQGDTPLVRSRPLAPIWLALHARRDSTQHSTAVTGQHRHIRLNEPEDCRAIPTSDHMSSNEIACPSSTVWAGVWDLIGPQSEKCDSIVTRYQIRIAPKILGAIRI